MVLRLYQEIAIYIEDSLLGYSSGSLSAGRVQSAFQLLSTLCICQAAFLEQRVTRAMRATDSSPCGADATQAQDADLLLRDLQREDEIRRAVIAAKSDTVLPSSSGATHEFLASICVDDFFYNNKKKGEGFQSSAAHPTCRRATRTWSQLLSPTVCFRSPSAARRCARSLRFPSAPRRCSSNG
jgi:hypothetical protein